MFLIRCYVGVGFEVFLKNAEEKEKDQGGEKGDGRKRKGKRKRDEEPEDAKKGGDAESGSGDHQELDTYLQMLEEGPLSPLIYEHGSGDDKEDKSVKMTKGPDGLRYHILDIWLDELEKVCGEPVEEDPAAANADDNDEMDTKQPKTKLRDNVPMDLILRPMQRLQADSPNKIVRRRAAAVLDDERLADWGFLVREKDSDDEEDEEWGGFD